MTNALAREDYGKEVINVPSYDVIMKAVPEQTFRINDENDEGSARLNAEITWMEDNYPSVIAITEVEPE